MFDNSLLKVFLLKIFKFDRWWTKIGWWWSSELVTRSLSVESPEMVVGDWPVTVIKVVYKSWPTNFLTPETNTHLGLKIIIGVIWNPSPNLQLKLNLTSNGLLAYYTPLH